MLFPEFAEAAGGGTHKGNRGRITTMSHIWIYLVLALSSVLNIIVPISGSATITPLLALITDPHKAIGLTSFYLVMSGIIRIFLFRKDIDWREIRILFVPSVVAAILGALAIVAVPANFLLILVFFSAVYFLWQRIHPQEKKSNSLVNYLVGLFSGFLQGTGLAGSDLRNSYLYAQKLDIKQVHGTTSLIGTGNFLAATIVRLLTHQLSLPDLTPLLALFPLIIVSILIGRHILYKLSKDTSNTIVIVTMVIINVTLGYKIVQGII